MDERISNLSLTVKLSISKLKLKLTKGREHPKFSTDSIDIKIDQPKYFNQYLQVTIHFSIVDISKLANFSHTD